VESRATDHNSSSLGGSSYTGIYRNILVCHFRNTGSGQRVITRYKPLSGKHFGHKVISGFPRLADGVLIGGVAGTHEWGGRWKGHTPMDERALQACLRSARVLGL